MDELELVDSVRVREVGNCGNCKTETEYYDIGLEEYVCCYRCGQELTDKLYKFLETQG